MVEHTCHPSYTRGISKRIVVQAKPGKNVRLYSKNNLKSKRRWGKQLPSSEFKFQYYQQRFKKPKN
jgi:hypothetical protein